MVYTLLSYNKTVESFLYETTYGSLAACLLKIQEMQKTTDNLWQVYPNLYNPYGEDEHEIVCFSNGVFAKYRIIVKDISK